MIQRENFQTKLHFCKVRKLRCQSYSSLNFMLACEISHRHINHKFEMRVTREKHHASSATKIQFLLMIQSWWGIIRKSNTTSWGLSKKTFQATRMKVNKQNQTHCYKSLLSIQIDITHHATLPYWQSTQSSGLCPCDSTVGYRLNGVMISISK